VIAASTVLSSCPSPFTDRKSQRLLVNVLPASCRQIMNAGWKEARDNLWDGKAAGAHRSFNAPTALPPDE